MKSYRSRQVGVLIKKELASYLSEVKNEFSLSFITVTDARVTPDIRYADVWISILGDKAQRKSSYDLVCSKAWRIRQELAHRLHLRRIPELRFKLDESLDIAERIDRILKDNRESVSGSDHLIDNRQQNNTED